MPGKASYPALQDAEGETGSGRLQAHRCFACMSSGHSEKRDCAIARIIADGIDPQHVAHFKPSAKTEH